MKEVFKSLFGNIIKIISGILVLIFLIISILFLKAQNLSQYSFLLFLDKQTLFLLFLFLVGIIGLFGVGVFLVVRVNKIRQFGRQKDSWLTEQFKIFLGLKQEQDCVEEYFKINDLLLQSFLNNQKRYRYTLPWYLTFGSKNSGKSSFMSCIDLEQPIKSNIDDDNYLNHYFFNNGIVIDVNTDLILNDDSHDFSWSGLLGNLQKMRQDKCIDGVIYFVSLKEMLEDAQSGTNHFKKQNEYFYFKLWQMQKVFSMRVPVYVIFTHLDYIEGFKEFVDIINDYHDDIFGWSNPHSINSIFKVEWLDEMCHQINTSLKFIQSEMMVNFSDTVSFDMMNFLNNFKNIQNHIKTFLKTTFKDNKYASGLYFRGVYFSALENHQSISDELPFLQGSNIEYQQHVEEKKKLYFGLDILEQKIFKERNIGQNEMDYKILKGELVKYKTFISVFVCFAIGYIYKVHKNCLYIEDTLQPKIFKVIEVLNLAQKDNDFNHSKEFQDELNLLLVYLEEIARYDLLFYGVPSSLVCSVNRNKNKLFYQAYNKLVIENLYKELAKRCDDLAKERFITPSYDTDYNLTTPIEMHDFKNLNSLVNELNNLETYEKRLKSIIKYNSVSNLKYLLHDMYNITIPSNFAKKIMYSNHVQDNEKLRYQIEMSKLEIQRKFNWCVDQFDKNCFSQQRIVQYFADLDRFLFLVDNESKTLSIENIRAVQLKISSLISFLNSPESEWLRMRHFSMPEYVSMVDKIITSETLDVSRDVFFARIESSYIKFKTELSNYQVAMIGSPFYINSNKSIEISPAILDVHGILNNIFSESFMMMPVKQNLENIFDDEHIKWRSSIVDEVAQIIKNYEAFIARKSVNKFEQCVQLIAVNNIINVINHKLCKARNVVILRNDKSYLADLAANIKRNDQAFCEILHFAKKNDADFFMHLKKIQMKNLNNFLQHVHISLDRDNLYQVSAESLGLDVDSKKLFFRMNLAEYLVSQRDLFEFYVKDLARDAVKQIEYIRHLENGKISLLVSKFKGLEIGLDNYKANPSNSELYKLEKFLSVLESTSLSLLMSDLRKENKLLSVNRYLENKIILIKQNVNAFLRDEIIKLVDEHYQEGKDFFQEYSNTFPFTLSGELIGLKGFENMEYLAKKQKNVLDVSSIIDPYFKPRTIEFVDTLEKCSKLVNYIKSSDEYIVMKFLPYQGVAEMYEKNLKFLVDFSAQVQGQKPISIYWVGELKIYDHLEFNLELAKNSSITFSGLKNKSGYQKISNTLLKVSLDKKQLVRFLLENVKIIDDQSFIRFTIDIEDDKGRKDVMVIMLPIDLSINGLTFKVPQQSFNKLLGGEI